MNKHFDTIVDLDFVKKYMCLFVAKRDSYEVRTSVLRFMGAGLWNNDFNWWCTDISSDGNFNFSKSKIYVTKLDYKLLPTKIGRFL